MKINCHTNLDLYPCERWPTELPCRPVVGDIITSSTGLELKVCRIVFVERNHGREHLKELNSRRAEHLQIPESHMQTESYVQCNVELHLPKHRWGSVSEFEKWYRNRVL